MQMSEFVLFAWYNYDDEVEEDEISRACSMHGGKGIFTEFGGKDRQTEMTRNNWT